MNKYSMNDYIYFKLTESGQRILDKMAEKFHRENPKMDIKWGPDPWRGDWYKEQLWQLFQWFGGTSYCGGTLAAYDLTFVEPPEEKIKETKL